jgi:hypothetical protein
MSEQSKTQIIDPYLPAGLQMSDEPGPVERFLTKPFRQQAAIWLTDE